MFEKFDEKTVEILGTEYTIFVRKYDEDQLFKNNDWVGYCSNNGKYIVICNLTTHPTGVHAPYTLLLNEMKRNLRHELTHAFLHESGLASNSYATPSSWADNEEMVDWFALQSPKMFKLFKELELV